jgi:hypothetical protein
VPAPLAVLGPSADARDRFKGLERRLRELGATYYRLETWGDGGELYRFQCQLEFSGNAPSNGPPANGAPFNGAPPNRQFEATDRDAFQAMARVVHDVEDWRTGRLR